MDIASTVQPGAAGSAGQFPQPAAPVSSHQYMSKKWSSGLCDCCDDMNNCCITCWCPCITFGQVAEIVDRGATSCITAGALYCLIRHMTGCQWIYAGWYRYKLRKQYGLPMNIWCDCCVHHFCDCCALCQEYRELKSRGYDMDSGWQGQIERFSGIQTVPPSYQVQMAR